MNAPPRRVVATDAAKMVLMRLILASASPSRLRLLRAAGIEPEVVVSDVDEEELSATMPGATPEQLAVALAQAKAAAVAARYPDRLVLGADSVFDVDGESLGKPLAPEVAIDRIRQVRGRSGELITGHCLIHPGGSLSAAERTVVHFTDMEDRDIEAYVATGEPLHVAGGFTLDGYGSAFVRAVDGDPSNVIGLAVPLVRQMVESAGVRWTDLWGQAGDTANWPSSDQ